MPTQAPTPAGAEVDGSGSRTLRLLEVAIVVTCTLCFLAGSLARSWWAFLLPLVVLPLLYVGLGQGWWGSGLGAAWQLAAALVIGAGLAATGLGVVLGHVFFRARSPEGR